MNTFLQELLDSLIPWRITKERALSLVVVFSAFLVTAQTGIFLYRDVGTSPAVIWAPVGIAFAALILEGYGMLPAIFLASLASALLIHAPFLPLVVSVFGNTVQPVLGYYFLQKTGFDRALGRVKDMFLMLLMSLFASMIVPTFNIATLGVSQWTSIWVGGALSALILTPLLIRWIHFEMAPRTRAQMIETGLAVGFAAALSVFFFATPYTSVGSFSLFYPLMIVLVWIAFRTGARFMTLSLFLMTAISLLGALYGTHVPPEMALGMRIFNTEIFDLIIAVIFFMLVSVEEQRKNALKAFKEKTEELQTALNTIRDEDTAKNEFIATLAHELRNPLATLLSSTELIALDAPAKSESAELVGIMHSRILVMGRLLDDLLDIARITRKEFVIQKQRVELSAVIRNVLETVGHAIQKKSQTIDVSLPMGAVILQADPTRLEQAFINLFYNAVKYTPEGGHIDCTAKYQDGIVTVSVLDTGIGIPENMLSRIFEPFVQVAKKYSTQTEGLGTGLGIGLSLTKNLVELHGGTIEARRNPSGKGSEFVVTLPASLERPLPLSQKGQKSGLMNFSSTKGSKNGLELLVVDDNEAAATSLGKLLALKGHRVSIVTNGKDAIARMLNTKPRAVLLDLGLGDMDGCDVALEIRKHNTESVLIAMTGYGQAEDKERTRQAGFAYHMTKPVGLGDVEAVLAEVAAR